MVYRIESVRSVNLVNNNQNILEYLKYEDPLLGLKTGSGDTFQKNDSGIHIVKSGETLYSIAKIYKVSVVDLKKWNNLKSDTIKVGMKLKISAPDPREQLDKNGQYIVKAGDNIYKIAVMFNITIAQLANWNPEIDIKKNNIKIGQKLFVSETKKEKKSDNNSENSTNSTENEKSWYKKVVDIVKHKCKKIYEYFEDEENKSEPNKEEYNIKVGENSCVYRNDKKFIIKHPENLNNTDIKAALGQRKSENDGKYSFYEDLALRESSWRKNPTNNKNFWGLYQMGARARNEGGYYGTRANFVNNPSIQQKTVEKYHAKIKNYIKINKLDRFLNKTYKVEYEGIKYDLKITAASMLAGGHLVGTKNLKVFLESLESGTFNENEVPKDGNGVSITQYMLIFSNEKYDDPELEKGMREDLSKIKAHINSVGQDYVLLKEGQTLDSIAKQFNVELITIKSYNPQLKDPNKLQPGTKIYLIPPEERE